MFLYLIYQYAGPHFCRKESQEWELLWTLKCIPGHWNGMGAESIYNRANNYPHNTTNGKVAPVLCLNYVAVHTTQKYTVQSLKWRNHFHYCVANTALECNWTELNGAPKTKQKLHLWKVNLPIFERSLLATLKKAICFTKETFQFPVKLPHMHVQNVSNNTSRIQTVHNLPTQPLPCIPSSSFPHPTTPSYHWSIYKNLHTHTATVSWRCKSPPRPS